MENLLPKIGDKMILTWFKKHHPYGHLIGALKNSSCKSPSLILHAYLSEYVHDCDKMY